MLRFFHLVLVLLTLTAYLVPMVDPNTFWPIATLGILLPWLWFGMLLFAIYWVIRREKVFWVSLLTLILGLDSMQSLFAIPDATDVTAEWSITSFNGHAFRTKFAPELDEKTGVEDFLSSLSSDIICLQEYRYGTSSVTMTNAIKAKTGLEYHHHDRDGGLIILSKFPLKNGKTTYFSNRANGYQCADVETPQGWIRVCNVHLQTNAISGMASQVAENTDLTEKDTWLTLKGMFGRYGRASKKRVEQARQILDEIKTSPYPVVLCGDFNEVPSSYMHSLFKAANLNDAHLQQHWGFGATYATNMPGIRIDYIFSSPQLETISYRRFSKGFSDHRPIQASFSFK